MYPENKIPRERTSKLQDLEERERRNFEHLKFANPRDDTSVEHQWVSSVRKSFAHTFLPG